MTIKKIFYKEPFHVWYIQLKPLAIAIRCIWERGLRASGGRGLGVQGEESQGTGRTSAGRGLHPPPVPTSSSSQTSAPRSTSWTWGGRDHRFTETQHHEWRTQYTQLLTHNTMNDNAHMTHNYKHTIPRMTTHTRHTTPHSRHTTINKHLEWQRTQDTQLKTHNTTNDNTLKTQL